LDLSSDHSPIILNLYSNIQMIENSAKLFSRKTNWMAFRYHLDDLINTNISLKNEEELEFAVVKFTQAIQNAAWEATPDSNNLSYKKRNSCSNSITDMIKLKRKLRQKWQLSRSISLKTQLNQITKTLKYEIAKEKNESVQKYLSELTPFKTTDYDLWKATKKLKKPTTSNPPIRKPNGKWARNDKEKADNFARHLSDVFEEWNIHTIEQYRYK